MSFCVRLRLCGVALGSLACSGDSLGPTVPVSVALDSLPFPSVVAGDTLRDSSGVAQPVRAQAFNFRGEPLADPPFRYTILDRGAVVDSVTGAVRGDSVRATPVRIVALLGELQTAPANLPVVARPESLAAVTVSDTIRYSLTDSTANLSKELTVRLLGGAGAAVPSWLVSFRISSPTDTLLAALVGDDGKPSRVDTTASDGNAARRVRLQPARLTATADSVVVLGSARYRGAHVRGSPRRIVVHVRPRSP